MRMRILSRVVLGVLAACLLVPSFASGQVIGKAVDEALAKQMGVKAAQFVIYPTLGTAFQYNSNLYYVSADDSSQKAKGAGILMFYPGLAIETGKEAALGLTITGQLEARKYLDSSKAASSQSTIGGVAGFDALFFRKGPVQLGLNDQFKYQLQRRNVEMAGTWDRVFNQAGVNVGLVPGGGALRFNFGYAYLIDFFTDMDADWGDVVVHQLSAKFNWKWLPFTAFIADVNWQLRDYVADGYGRYGESTDNKPFKARFGINGAFTRTISALIVGGYGNSMHDVRPVAAGDPVPNKGENDSYSGVIGQARLTWAPNKQTMLQGGYSRDFRDNLFTNFLVTDELKVTARQKLGTKVQVTADVAYSWLGYSTLPAKYGTSLPAGSTFGNINRTDTELRASLACAADITRWLGVSLGYTYDNLMSDFYMKAPVVGGATRLDKMDYKVQIVDAMLIFRY